MSQMSQHLFAPEPALELTLTLYTDGDRIDFNYLRLDGQPLRVADVRNLLTTVLAHLAAADAPAVVTSSSPTLFTPECV